MRKLRLTALMLCALSLSACTGAVPVSQDPGPSLPPVEIKYAAPVDDSHQEYAQTVLLSLPSRLDGQLMMLPERILLPADQHPAEASVRKLLSFAGNDSAGALFPEAGLQLLPGGLELSGDVATVNLGENALNLSKQDLFTLRRALANTLVQWPEIHYVNVLVEGREPGLDEGARLPMGSLQQTRNEDAPALWDSLSAGALLEQPEAQRFSSLCTLYFPAPSGRGLLAEARTVSFRGQSPLLLSLGLLEALSAGSREQTRLPKVPDLIALLAAQPELVQQEDGRVIKLRFLQIANQIFIEAGIPRSIMLASLSYTLSTFIPDLQGISVQIGNELIEAIVPSGIYQGAGEQILFSAGTLRRQDFSSFLLTDCSLYFAGAEGKLIKVSRPVPYQLAYSKRYLLGQLMLGPQAYDSRQNIQPVFPRDIAENDLIAIGQEGGAALVNFGGRFQTLSQRLSPERERLMVYAMVNTLCDSRGISKVVFYIEGEQPERLAGTLYLPGEFLRNPDIMDN